MKCSFCKMNYNNDYLFFLPCPNVKNRKISICKVCEKKHDISKRLEKKIDALYINALKSDLKKKGIFVNDEILELSKINAKLKREIRNARKT